jgi:hypothetical protein
MKVGFYCFVLGIIALPFSSKIPKEAKRCFCFYATAKILQLYFSYGAVIAVMSVDRMVSTQ